MGNLRLTAEQNQNQSGFAGYGALLTVGRQPQTGAAEWPGSFVGALMGITAINIRTNVIPSYHMRSLGRYQSFAPGLRDGGEVAAAVNWLPGYNDTQGRYAADWSLLRQASLESNELTRLRVLAPDPDLHLITCRAFLTQLGPLSYQPEAIMSGQVGWKIVGEPEQITPLVYQVSGFTTGTAGAGVWDSTNAADNASAAAAGTSAALLTGANSSDTGSVAAGIFVNGEVRRAISAPTLTFDGTVGTDSTLSVTVGDLVASDTDTVAVGDVGKVRIRLFIPGQYELWGTYASTNVYNTTAVSMGEGDNAAAISDDVEAFITALIANGGRCHLAVYGGPNIL